MDSFILKRVYNEANYVIETNSTIRQTAKIFNISKSTVHKDLHERLLYVNKKLYDEVYDILQYHIDVRHIRGGQSTKKNMKNWLR